jgi:RNA polymerase sigma factor (sigma-70 family)
MHEPENLCSEFKNLIIKLCRRYYVRNNSRFSFEDLVSEAKLALFKAHESFDDSRGAKFSTFAYSAMDNELRKFVSNNSYDLKITEYEQRKQFKAGNQDKLKGDGIAISIDDNSFQENNYSVFASGEEPPDVTLIRNESLGILREEMELLPDRERIVIEEYWLNKRTLEDIASGFGVTKQTVHGWKNKGFSKLQRRVKSRLGEN